MDYATIIRNIGAEVIVRNYSTDQVNDATKAQLKSLMNWPTDVVLTSVLYEKIKRYVTRRMEVNIRDQVKTAINNELKSWIDSNYPDAELEQRQVNGKPVIEIWYKGKPVIDKG